MATPPPSAKSGVDVALAEFAALRAEISNRLTTMAALVGVGLTALGVIVSLVVKEDGDERLLLAVPPIAVAVNFLWSVENRQVRLIGSYIRTRLWPYLINVDADLPSWECEVEKLRAGWRKVLRSIVTDFAIPVLFAAAAFASVVVVGDSVKVDGREETVSGWLRVADFVLASVALAVPFLMARVRLAPSSPADRRRVASARPG